MDKFWHPLLWVFYESTNESISLAIDSDPVFSCFGCFAWWSEIFKLILLSRMLISTNGPVENLSIPRGSHERNWSLSVRWAGGTLHIGVRSWSLKEFVHISRLIIKHNLVNQVIYVEVCHCWFACNIEVCIWFQLYKMMYLILYIVTRIYSFTIIYIYVLAYVYMCCIRVHTYTYVRTYTHIHTHTYIYVHIIYIQYIPYYLYFKHTYHIYAYRTNIYYISYIYILLCKSLCISLYIVLYVPLYISLYKAPYISLSKAPYISLSQALCISLCRSLCISLHIFVYISIHIFL